MTQSGTVPIKDGCTIHITQLTYPIAITDQMTLIQLWRSEWTKTDFDWIQAMSGAYSDTLVMQSMVAALEGEPVGTATVCYPRHQPEVAVISSVVTLAKHRGLGIAMHLTNAAAQRAFAAGCRVCYLGATRDPRCVYRHCGFDWWQGNIMRRAAAAGDECESQFFAPGQRTSIRQAEWGDLPGVSCLMAQPLDYFIVDYPRGLVSAKYCQKLRCVSNFPVMLDDVTKHGGSMCSLIGDAAHRVLGFGTMTPGPGEGRKHKAVIDVAVHAGYDPDAAKLIRHLLLEAAKRDIKVVQAYVAANYQVKVDWFKRAGFQPVASLPHELRVMDKMVDVEVLQTVF